MSDRSEPSGSTGPVPNDWSPRPSERLAALAQHLLAHKLFTDLSNTSALITDSQDEPWSGSGEVPSVRVVCRERPADGDRLWFFTADGAPLAPHDQVFNAVTEIKGRLARQRAGHGS
ncbi:hypothetical protein [Actinomadura harenae]|uniref:Uncharacterized protein n=1 Tax=Actinomadura harenae TaxID=2483351 RepID=A0A3M2M6W8_9ACTN|nr:hypothetical protein [Actinomadura harenae]RMI44720.1 hypothetical protein EBO15_12265 [Actinomadura harenae]